MKEKTKSYFIQGLKDGIPIGLGYFAVSFSLGIAMRNASMLPHQGFLMSAANLASAGQYAGLQVILADASYFQMALVTLVANARYLLMSTALSQHISPKTPFYHRFFMGYGVTDEIFGIAINQPGYVEPSYIYGALAVAVPGWAIGTALGIAAGNILPVRIVSALSVALYGMFLAVIIPPSKKDRVIAVCVIVSFVLSYFTPYIPLLKNLNSGMKVIVLTIIISSIAAILKPHPQGDIHDAT